MVIEISLLFLSNALGLVDIKPVQEYSQSDSEQTKQKSDWELLFLLLSLNLFFKVG
jgi:hypothetical protein